MRRIMVKSRRWVKISLLLMVLDIIIVVLAYGAALIVRYDFKYSSIPFDIIINYIKYIPADIVLTVFVFSCFRLYRSIWKFAGFTELWKGLLATFIINLSKLGIHMIMDVEFPIAYYVIGWMLLCAGCVGLRFSYRFIRLMRSSRHQPRNNTGIMIIGAGEAGKTLLREIRVSNKTQGVVRCFIDDDANKCRRYIDGVPIVGGRDRIPEAVEEYNISKIIFAIPVASAKDRRDILNICKETRCEVKAIPGIYQLVNGEVNIKGLRDVSIEDLLEREPVRVNIDDIAGYVKEKVVLVTGGGGSIGSELCRQIAGHEPKQLIILDIFENSVYELQQELKKEYPGLNMSVLIGSVRNTHRVDSIFDEYRPQIVFHAAAHKHVPLMECSPNEAIKNNVFGTRNVAVAAMKYKAQKMILISTDKAVNPTNIMGASKRICEMIIQLMAAESVDTDFVAVRFGNVLGSNGSVIPLFKKQIAEGGPVTVTDKNIIRYFMTIPEAVSLVLQAGAYAKGGQIYVLDMGKPVKIDDMARNLIKLSGFEPDVDIPIVYTGLRPGEKMYEECLKEEEGLTKTANNLIFVARPLNIDAEQFKRQLVSLKEKAYEDTDEIFDIVSEIVPTYQRSEQKFPSYVEVKSEVSEEDAYKETAAAMEMGCTAK